VKGTLFDTGLFQEQLVDLELPKVPRLPECYDYHRSVDGVTGIKGWALGYEDGGPLEKKREFPVLCADLGENEGFNKL
jgi:hypothetical protein